MLRRLNVQTRLVTVIAVPLVLLFAVAVPQVLSSNASRAYLAGFGGALVLAVVLALAAARSITRPLRELTEAADRLAEERLPQLVDALRHPAEDDQHYLSAAMEPIEVGADDELGHLAQAFNLIQSVAVDVAAEQAALLKKGISELYVNLARRNQALLDRQIQLLDQLEREEQDTEVLEHLYLLDHLATRMRRNAESLLVLAGAESGPRRSKAAPVVDVVRAAVSEVEEYERVDLGTVAPAMLMGPVVTDVAHIVAELIENATQFSPPHSMVRVDGSRSGGSYQLVISDQGLGLQTEQLDQLNALLRDPPVTGLALGRSLGCLVAARLAARHGITVRLRSGIGEGVAAYVVLPRHLLAPDAVEPLIDGPAMTELVDDDPTSDTTARHPKRPEASRAAAGPEPSLTVRSVDADGPVSPPTPAVARADADAADGTDRAVPPTLAPAAADGPPAPADAPPVRLTEALPRQDFEAGIQALLQAEAPPVEPAPEPIAVATTLTRRIPGATTEPLPVPHPEPPVRRDPETVRNLLSRYRSGLEAGRAPDGPPDEERS